MTACLRIAAPLLGVVLVLSAHCAFGQSGLDKLKGLAGSKKANTIVDVGSDALRGLTLSDEEVASLGAEAALAYDAKSTVLPADDAYARRLAAITSGLENDSGLKLNFKAYQNPEVNAFALPDGSVRVYSGLMDLMTDDELRFVIGHEIGHVKHGHSKERFRTGYLTQAARKGVAANSGVAGKLASSELGGLVESVVNARHSQSNELESDQFGLALLQRTGHDPQAAVTALRKLDDGGPKAGMLSSHPDPAKRASLIERRIDK